MHILCPLLHDIQYAPPQAAFQRPALIAFECSVRSMMLHQTWNVHNARTVDDLFSQVAFQWPALGAYLGCGRQVGPRH
jgi:hypothetical protein